MSLLLRTYNIDYAYVAEGKSENRDTLSESRWESAALQWCSIKSRRLKKLKITLYLGRLFSVRSARGDTSPVPLSVVLEDVISKNLMQIQRLTYNFFSSLFSMLVSAGEWSVFGWHFKCQTWYAEMVGDSRTNQEAAMTFYAPPFSWTTSPGAWGSAREPVPGEHVLLWSSSKFVSKWYCITTIVYEKA